MLAGCHPAEVGRIVSRRLIEIDPKLERELAEDLHRDRYHDECGVVGIHGHSESANIAYLALYALQHRGQESAGIVTWAPAERGSPNAQPRRSVQRAIRARHIDGPR